MGPPLTGRAAGGAETHHSTLRDRFQVFPQPDCSFSEFHNQAFDSMCGDDSAAGLRALHHAAGIPHTDTSHGSHSDLRSFGAVERALTPHATRPSAAGPSSSELSKSRSRGHCMTDGMMDTAPGGVWRRPRPRRADAAATQHVVVCTNPQAACMEQVECRPCIAL